MAFVHGAAGFHVFSLSVYNYIAGMKVNDIIVGEEEIGDPIIMVTSEVIAPIEPVLAYLDIHVTLIHVLLVHYTTVDHADHN